MSSSELAKQGLSAIPRVRLAYLPTPLVEVRRLTAKIGGPGLWIKRDDLTGFGFGGNKIRGLEFLLADALAQGADTLVTGAGPQSNYVRATAAAATHTGLAMVAIYSGTRPLNVEGNYRLTCLLGAEVRFTGNPDRASVDGAIEGFTVSRPVEEAQERVYTFLDPTYTGKALAGFIAHSRIGHFRRDETVIFLHTGGEPALFVGEGSWLNE